MKRLPIVVMDSGIGGLNVLHIISQTFCDEQFIYLSDAKNMPYGNKDRARIEFFCKKNLQKIKRYKPKAIVIACNTMSLVGYEIFKNCNFAPVFFVLPNHKKILELGAENCLLLCTKKSAESEPIRRLSNICSTCVLALTNLAKQIEQNPHSAHVFLNEKIMQKIRRKKYVFLGCTHYIFCENYLKKVFPKKTFFNGIHELIADLSKSLNLIPSKQNNLPSLKIKFIGSGRVKNKRIFKQMAKL